MQLGGSWYSSEHTRLNTKLPTLGFEGIGCLLVAGWVQGAVLAGPQPAPSRMTQPGEHVIIIPLQAT